MFKCFSIGANNFRDMYVCECGVHAYDNDYERAADSKSNYGSYLIHFIIKGKGIIRHMSQKKIVDEYTASEGQFFIIFPENECEYEPDKDDPWYYFWVALKGSRARDYIENLIPFNESVITVSNKHELEHLFLQLIEKVENETEFNFYIANKMYNLLIALAEGCKKPEIVKNTRKETLSKATTYISLHKGEKITVGGVAAKLNIDRSYLYNLFMEEIGVSPSEYISNLKLDYACELLLDGTDKSIKEVAYLVGFDDPQHFSRNFMKGRGLPPSKWKAEHLPKKEG